MFINGTQVGSDYADANDYLVGSALRLGRGSHSAAGFYVGYIDEVRITKGRARYTTAFVPPSAQFPRTAPVSAQRWRIYITANEGHTNTSIAEIVFKEFDGTPLSYAGGTATASSQLSGSFVPGNAFDGNASSRWATAGGQQAPAWIEMEFAAPVAPWSVDIQAPPVDANDSPRDFAIEYYDGADWVAIKSYAGETGWANGEVRSFSLY